MTPNPISWIRPAAVAVAGIAASSCAYGPDYHSPGTGSYSAGSSPIRSASIGTSYSSGHISTSLFISTGDPRWGYDPSCQSYYDYTRRSYYDPWLNGYYPRGYRPTIVIGVPHPHGWRPGRSVCPPPRHVRHIHLKDYRKRDLAYRRLGHAWSKDIRDHDHARPASRHTPGRFHSRPGTHRDTNTTNRDDHSVRSRGTGTRSHVDDRSRPASWSQPHAERPDRYGRPTYRRDPGHPTQLTHSGTRKRPQATVGQDRKNRPDDRGHRIHDRQHNRHASTPRRPITPSVGSQRGGEIRPRQMAATPQPKPKSLREKRLAWTSPQREERKRQRAVRRAEREEDR